VRLVIYATANNLAHACVIRRSIFISADSELVYIMSFNTLNYLQQMPSTDAILFFICRHCSISEIASSAFVDAPNIALLDLSYNELTAESLNPDVFKGPENDEKYAPIKLDKLVLSHNNINYLEKLTFEHTPDLKSLDLSYNPFKTFNDNTELALASLQNIEVSALSELLTANLNACSSSLDPYLEQHGHF